jgi:hypothetical protein
MTLAFAFFFGAIASVLYDQLRVIAPVDIVGEHIKSPSLVMTMGIAITSYNVGRWKDLQSRYRVVE